MKAISLWQPWASLIACGAKPYETRSWAPPASLIGQHIAIHAAKKVTKETAGFAEEILYHQHGAPIADALDESWGDVPPHLEAKFGEAYMPVGCVVAIAKLDAAFQLGEEAKGTAFPAATVTRRMISRPKPACFTVRYDEFGNYSAGRWAWLLTEIQPLRPPIEARGAQGFFNLPQGWLTGSTSTIENREAS